MKKECATCGVEKIANKTKSSQFARKRNSFRPDCKTCTNRLANNKRKEARRLKATKEMEAIGRNPYGFLAAGIIELAIREYRNWKDGEGKTAVDYRMARAMARKSGFVNPIEEIEAFFASDWFVELCGFCEVDAEYMRKHILEEQDA